MPYRDDREALESRRATLQGELADIRARTHELDALRSREAEIARELAAAEKLLANMAARNRALPMLENVRIASPCTASWDDMVGDAQVRFCGKCEKNVYNLSAMSRDEGERLLREKEGAMCARLYRRADGTVITADCPVGVRKKRMRRVAVTAVGGGLLAGWGFLLSNMGPAHVTVQGGIGEQPQVMGEMTMGDVAMPVTSAAPLRAVAPAPAPSAPATSQVAPLAPRRR